MNQQSQIAQINDQIRASLSPNIVAALAFKGLLSNSDAVIMTLQNGSRLDKIHVTQGTMASGRLLEVLSNVRTFYQFSKENDPHGEHDFGSFQIASTKFFWKFDYFDENFEFFAENGNRVLTIMLTEEY